ncbi:MAG: MtnX-like HAD-IB family phosphatase [Chloroflexi bacterium]|nr:MtnX-like HAD-IB family phosphatase [Chloroflexota bacterium]
MSEVSKTLVQCDFDGTITEEDVSFVMLDAFAGGDWRQLFREYEEGKISVGRFNTQAFAMVKADRQSLLEIARSKVKVRPGFQELVACCRRKGFRLVIVSNGLDFYIEKILRDIGLADIEVFAARTRFHPGGLKVQYIGPDGSQLDSDFKAAYVALFLREGYRIIYAGNGNSDIAPARQCHHIFATGNLLAHCQQTNLACTAFTDFNEVVSVLELL